MIGDLVEFPAGEPEGEAPQKGYCKTCGVEMTWPNDVTGGWPASCPNGCTPVVVTSYPPEPKK